MSKSSARILIVEDDENKREQLKQFLSDLMPHASYKVANSYKSGVRSLKEELPDVVILDMTLPNFDPGPDESGGKTHPLGGRDFLDEMARFEIDVPVIVVTQFETFGKGSEQMNLRTLDAQLKRRYGHLYRGAVYYHAAIHGWKKDLRDRLSGVFQLGNSGEVR